MIATLVLAASLAAAAALAHGLVVRSAQQDVDVLIEQEQDRFQQSMTQLLPHIQRENPDMGTRAVLRQAVEEYLALNPASETYWTIVTFAEGGQLASSTGPSDLEPLYHDETLPEGELNQMVTLSTPAGPVRTSSLPVEVAGTRLARLQVVAPLAQAQQGARDVALALAAASGVALGVGAVVLAATMWRALNPLRDLAEVARSTEFDSLDTRVDVPEAQDEVAALATEFNRMMDRLAAASAREQEFLATVSHELRTPITIARGHLEVLEVTGVHDPQARADTVRILRDELGRMSRLVEDLMTIARSQSEDFVRARPVDLVEWFEGLDLKRAGVDSWGHVVIVPPPPESAVFDPDRMAQAVLNLVANAVVHSQEGTRVEVTASVAADRLHVAVADEGPGIPPEIRDKVFQPFVRAGGTNTSMGLGMAVVRAVVDSHGGTITMNSDSGGTAVVLTLPRSGGTVEGDHRARDAVLADSPGAG